MGAGTRVVEVLEEAEYIYIYPCTSIVEALEEDEGPTGGVPEGGDEGEGEAPMPRGNVGGHFEGQEEV